MLASLPVIVFESEEAAPQQVISEAYKHLTIQVVDQGVPVTGLSECLAAKPQTQK